MARNNNNRPRVNNRTRNLSSFIPQPRSSIVDNNRIQERPLEPFQVYSNSQEVQNYRDWMQSMEANMWARSSTQPVWLEDYVSVQPTIINTSAEAGQIIYQTLENFISENNISEETQELVRNIWTEENTSYPGIDNSTISVTFNREMDAIPSISREELEAQRQDLIVREYAERVANNILADNHSTQFNRPYNIRDREGNIIPRDRLEEIMADRESRLRDAQRERTRTPNITRDEVEQAVRFVFGNRDQSDSLLDESIRTRERQLFENRSNSIGDYIAWLGSQSNLDATQFRARRAGTGYSGSMIFGTPGIIDEEPTIYGERFDNIIIISNSNPLSSYTRQTQGWGKGYAIVESDNMLSKRGSNWETLDIDVHGGITYNNKITEDFIETKFGKSLHLTSDDIGKTILGFDTSHYNSKELFPTRESVLEETIKLALQCAAY